MSGPTAWLAHFAHAGCWLALVVLLALCPGKSVLADNIESVLRPGELVQGHAKWEEGCTKCHVRFDRAAQDKLCVDCHKEVGQDMRERTGFHGRQKPTTCRSCHTDHKGRNARIVEFDKNKFDHAQSDYLLSGKHAKVQCDRCHEPKKPYWNAPQDCNACHKRDDVHKGSLGTKCGDCHTEGSWKEAKFDHDKTRFPLTGKHDDTKCVDCHKKGVDYKATPQTCIACHKKDDDTAKGHKGLYGEKCESCHGSKGWKPSIFNHDTDTSHALRGKHRSIKCTDCHTRNPYKEKRTSTCVDCHKKDDDGPRGHKGTLGRDCAACHSERDWKEAPKFDHNRTDFPLLDKHRDVKCAACHTTKDYKDAPNDCIGCHKQDDKHAATLGTQCKDCHNERDWKDVRRFDHDKTKFKLREAHAARTVQCKDCHADLKHFRNTPLECYSCHKKDDKHETTLGKECKDCHGERDWKDVSRFDHDKTRFRLRSAHAAKKLQCKVCHADLKQYRDTPKDCDACHKKDDKHEGQEGSKCERCHGDVDWKTSNFNHNQSRFPLLGKHASVKCKDCHATPRFKDAPLDCYSCHKKDDSHRLRFGLACEVCHNARNWRIWDYDHSRLARHVLDGAHAKLGCVKCHSEPAPKGKNAATAGNTCIACHRRDDVHDGAFGPICEQCHSTDHWKRIRSRVGAAPGTPDAWLAALGHSSRLVRGMEPGWR